MKLRERERERPEVGASNACSPVHLKISQLDFIFLKNGQLLLLLPSCFPAGSGVMEAPPAPPFMRWNVLERRRKPR